MNPATATCLRHSSQVSAGFCPSCLEEKLHEFYTGDRGRRREQDGDNPSILPSSSSDFDQTNSQVREKRTLLSLFLLEDELTIELQRQSSSSTADPSTSGSLKRSSSFKSRLPWRRTRSAQREEDERTEKESSSSSHRKTSFSCPLPCVKDSQTEVDRTEDPSRRRSSADTAEEIMAEAEKRGERRKSHVWSKVWSPFRDAALDRSLSEPGEEGRRRTRRRRAKLNEEVGHGVASNTPYPRRSVSSESGDVPAMRNEGLFWRRERGRGFSRSHSARMSSARYVGNGLLRFHLAPLGSSRTSSSRSRGRASYSFGPGLFSVR